jgi:hypothetical protein
MRFSQCILALLLMLSLCHTPLFAESIIEIGSEFQINQLVAGRQDHATVAMDRDGLVFVTWHTETDDRMKEIRARYMDTNGSSDELPVNYPLVAGDQRVPDVANNGGEEMVVVWSSETEGKINVLARRINMAREKVGNTILVNDQPVGKPVWPDVAMFENGDFIVVWEQLAGEEILIMVQLHEAGGQRIGDPLQVNRVPCRYLGGVGQATPDIAVSKADGEQLAVAAWSRNEESLRAVTAVRRFNPYTGRIGEEIEVDGSIPTGVEQKRPSVDINANGDVLVAWVESAELVPASVHALKLYGRTFPHDRWRYTIPGNDTYGQNRIVTRLFPTGDAVFAWDRNTGEPSHTDVYLMTFDAAGYPTLVEPFPVNSDESTWSYDQCRPALDYCRMADGHRVMISWESQGQDGDFDGVFGKFLYIAP